MLALDRDVQDFLSGGGTLIVPTRQRAAAVRLAYAAAQLAASRRCWQTPDVLSWQAWVERSLDAARARGAALPRRLRAAEEWLLWRTAVYEACADFGVLLPGELVDAVRSAVGLGEDFGIRPAAAHSPEAASLLHARSRFEARCAQLDALSSGQWWRCIELAAPLAPARLLGFDTLGPRRLQQLAQQGVLPWPAAPEPGEAADDVPAVQVVSAPDATSEIHAAAQWCREQLLRDPAARLLVVLPQLNGQRPQAVRAFADALAPATGPAVEPPFALEGGQPLAGYPLVAAALALVELSTGPLDYPDWSALLRSPYIGVGTAAQRLRLELCLRDQHIAQLDLPVLQRLAPLLQRQPRTRPEAALCLEWMQRLRPAASAQGRELPSVWARDFAALLDACGWPGSTALDSAEQQQRQRFDELLGEFAAMGAGAGPMDRREAQQTVQRLTQAVAYEPATEDVPVTVTGARTDPIVRYDGIWVAGLSADSWPAAAAPDALLPLPLQRAAGVPQASAAGQLQLARQQLRQWRRAARQLVLSWPRSLDTVERDPSALLAVFGAAVQVPAVRASARARHLQPQGRFETFVDERSSAWGEQRLPRGTLALELQSQCPFHAHAQLRLGAMPLQPPAPGIDQRLRGQLLHGALEGFWRETGSQAALQALTPAAQAARVEAAVAAAAAQLQARSAAVPVPGLWRQEMHRAAAVIQLLLESERARAPFSIGALESEQLWNCGGHSLLLRFDRIDRLADGGSVVIDYKSGLPPRFDPYAPRPPRPQLPAYALGAGVEVVAVALACLGREGSSWHGFADRKGRLEGLGAPGPQDLPWPQLLQQWQSQLQALAGEFATGHAPVQPLPHACDHCHLSLFCRVDRARLRAAAAQAADPEAAGDALTDADAALATAGEPSDGD